MSNDTDKGALVRQSNATAITMGAQYQPSDWGEMMRAADFMSKANVVPTALRGKPADVAMVLLTGAERGLPIATSLAQIHIIEGKISMSAEALRALVLRSGAAEYLECTEYTPERVTWATKRKGGRREQSVTWTPAKAKKAGLDGKANWRRHPEPMMSARASAELCRAVYPDVCGGLYTPDEAIELGPDQYDARIIEEKVDPNTGEVLEAETVAAPNLPADWTPPEQGDAEDTDAMIDELGEPGF